MNIRAVRAFYKRDELSGLGSRKGPNTVKERSHRVGGSSSGGTWAHVASCGWIGWSGVSGEHTLEICLKGPGRKISITDIRGLNLGLSKPGVRQIPGQDRQYLSPLFFGMFVRWIVVPDVFCAGPFHQSTGNYPHQHSKARATNHTLFALYTFRRDVGTPSSRSLLPRSPRKPPGGEEWD
jgi:hypothetical protein